MSSRKIRRIIFIIMCDDISKIKAERALAVYSIMSGFIARYDYF